MTNYNKSASQLELTPDQEELNFIEPQDELNALAEAAPPPSAWKVTMKRGRITGFGVSVSGAGAWAKLSGSMSFKAKLLEKSKTYKEMVRQHSISGGIRGFWGWIGLGANASTYKRDIEKSLKEISDSQVVTGKANVDMMVTGLYVNVQVDASAYLQVLRVLPVSVRSRFFFRQAGIC